MNGRITIAEGNFFDGIPAGVDIYMLVRVLHTWSAAECLRILAVCRAGLAPYWLLLLGEELLEPDPFFRHPAAYLTDMQMMAMFAVAWARTKDEFSTLLATSGLTLRRMVETASSVLIIEPGPG